MKKLVLLLPLFLLACVSLTKLTQGDLRWIQIGPLFEPYKGTVAVFTSKEEITQAYGYVGVGRIDGLARTRDSLLGAIERLKKAAAARGAEAVIISQLVDEENAAAGVSVSAHAIKYASNLTEADKAAIEEYKVLGALELE